MDAGHESKRSIGYLFSDAKRSKLRLEENVNESSRGHLIELVRVDLYKSLLEQNLTHLDGIIHRVHDYIPSLDSIDSNKYLNEFIQETERYKIHLIEPIDAVNLLRDRKKTAEAIEPITRASYRTFNIKVPPTIELKKGADMERVGQLLSDQTHIFKNSITGERLPCILKTTGCTSLDDYRHTMCIYFDFNEQDICHMLSILKHTSVVLSPFYNHDGVLYKLFILGEKWHLVVRHSIKNFDTPLSNKERVEFMSNTISKTDSTSPLNAPKESLEREITFDHSDLERLAKAVRECLQCQLIGVDLLLESNTRNLYIVDINYFPGFIEIHSLGDAFIDLFMKCPQKGADGNQLPPVDRLSHT